MLHSVPGLQSFRFNYTEHDSSIYIHILLAPFNRLFVKPESAHNTPFQLPTFWKNLTGEPYIYCVPYRLYRFPYSIFCCQNQKGDERFLVEIYTVCLPDCNMNSFWIWLIKWSLCLPDTSIWFGLMNDTLKRYLHIWLIKKNFAQ